MVRKTVIDRQGHVKQKDTTCQTRRLRVITRFISSFSSFHRHTTSTPSFPTHHGTHFNTEQAKANNPAHVLCKHPSRRSRKSKSRNLRKAMASLMLWRNSMMNLSRAVSHQPSTASLFPRRVSRISFTSVSSSSQVLHLSITLFIFLLCCD